MSGPGGPIVPPSVTTLPATAVTETAATLGIRLDDDGGEISTGAGVAWSPTNPLPSPNTDPHALCDPLGPGQSKTVNAAGLTPGVSYFFRAFKPNSAGTGFGAALTFATVGQPRIKKVMLGCAALINAGTYTAPFDAGIGAFDDYEPVVDLQESDPLRVAVIDSERVPGRENLSKHRDDYTVAVVVQQKIKSHKEADEEAWKSEIDALHLLTEQISDRLEERHILAPVNARYMSLSQPVLMSKDHLDRDKMFVSVLEVTYRVIR